MLKDVLDGHCPGQLKPAYRDTIDDDAGDDKEYDSEAGAACRFQNIRGLFKDAACDGSVEDEAAN